MAIAKVKEFMKSHGRENDVLEFDVSSATVDLAAEALGCEPAHIAKTVSLYDKTGENAVLIVTAGDRKIDNGKFKRLFGFKPHMIAWDDVERMTGHAPGGVCPFANPDGVAKYCDISLDRFDYVYPACGSSNSAIRLTPDELFGLSDAIDRIDVTKPREE